MDVVQSVPEGPEGMNEEKVKANDPMAVPPEWVRDQAAPVVEEPETPPVYHTLTDWFS